MIEKPTVRVLCWDNFTSAPKENIFLAQKKIFDLAKEKMNL